MSIRLDMLRAARRASSRLPEARGRLVDFLRGQFNADGGCRDRAGASDIYYTVFALEALDALQGEPPEVPTAHYLESFAGGERLDLVHLCCLLRCRATAGVAVAADGHAERIVARLESYRVADGGYNARPQAAHGTAYDAMLVIGAFQDLDREVAAAARLLSGLERLRSADGAYANGIELAFGNTPATAAAVTALHALGGSVRDGVAEWLLARHHDEGGFLATPCSPFPDLLSTATALHALALLDVDLGMLREPCLDFLDSLWTGEAFCGHWADDIIDSEHVYYALLALGHLSDDV